MTRRNFILYILCTLFNYLVGLLSLVFYPQTHLRFGIFVGFGTGIFLTLLYFLLRARGRV